jgi:hypothetical protein
LLSYIPKHIQDCHVMLVWTWEYKVPLNLRPIYLQWEEDRLPYEVNISIFILGIEPFL